MTRPSSVSALCVSEGQSPESAGPPFPCLCPCTSGSVITRMTTLTLWSQVTSAPSQEAEFGLSWCLHPCHWQHKAVSAQTSGHNLHLFPLTCQGHLGLLYHTECSLTGKALSFLSSVLSVSPSFPNE